MRMTTHEIVAYIVRQFEGGMSNHRDDRGGSTKYGITQATLTAWRASDGSGADLARLSLDEALRILRTVYLERPHIDHIGPWRLQFVVADYAIHSGPRAAIKALQRALGTVVVDGVLRPGGETLTAVHAHPDAPQLVRGVVAARLRLIGQLLSDPTQSVFARGWLDRIATGLTI